MLPKISIIIPTYNRSHLIGETLDSIIAQTYSNWECIVIDDGSNDYTSELMGFYCNKYPDIKFYNRPFHLRKGANSCRNFGFELSKGDYINWFDDDDLMHPAKLELQLGTLENSKYYFSVCQALVFNNRNDILGLRNPLIISDNTFYDYLRMKIGWLTQVPLWEKEFLIQNNFRFDNDLQAAQEWEFHLRVLNKYPNYTVIDESLVYIRQHEQSITYQNNEGRRLYYYFLARLKLYRNPDVKLDEESEEFLRDYLVNSFKRMITKNNPYAIKAYKTLYLSGIKFHTNAKSSSLLAIISYRIFNKGNFFLKRIKFF